MASTLVNLLPPFYTSKLRYFIAARRIQIKIYCFDLLMRTWLSLLFFHIVLISFTVLLQHTAERQQNITLTNNRLNDLAVKRVLPL